MNPPKHNISTPLYQIIQQQGIQLTKWGNGWRGLCPFHEETSPSFNVNDKMYHCFGCGASGGHVKWYMHHFKCDRHEALEMLGQARKLNIPLTPMHNVQNCLTYEQRCANCAKKLPLAKLAYAIIETKLGKAASKHIHINIVPLKSSLLTPNREIAFIVDAFNLASGFVGELEALRVWEDLIVEYYFPWYTDDHDSTTSTTSS